MLRGDDKQLWVGAILLLTVNIVATSAVDQQILSPANADRLSAPPPELATKRAPTIRLARRGRGLAQAYYIGKNHELVRYAFREIIASANRSTVRVLSEEKFVSLGTVVGQNGWILTKASELSGNVYCRIPEHGSLKASVHATDDQTDLALLKVKATNLTVAKLLVDWSTDDTEIKAGSLVAVPDGYAPDPLAIGIASTAKPRKVDQDRGIVGIQVDQPDPTVPGARVISIIPGSAAEESGLEPNDLVLEINGVELENHLDLIQRVGELRPGANVKLKVKRDDETWTETIELGRLNELLEDELALQNRLGGALSSRRSGFPEVIQHDSLVRANQCGGPLVNLAGEIIGINIARAGRVETFTLSSQSVGEALERMMPKTELTSENSSL